jgi:hypothetical protein
MPIHYGNAIRPVISFVSLVTAACYINEHIANKSFIKAGMLQTINMLQHNRPRQHLDHHNFHVNNAETAPYAALDIDLARFDRNN